MSRPSSVLKRLMCRLCRLGFAAGAILGLQSARPALAQFVNPGFESNSFTGWTLQYGRFNCGQSISWGSSLPTGHPAPAIVTSAAFGTANISNAICGAYMARINDLAGGKHATRLSQAATLRAADIDCGVSTVSVCWIAVVQNARHVPAENPQFSFTLVKTRAGNSTVIDSKVVESTSAATPGSGWTWAGSDLYYRQYCTPLHDFTAQVGDQLTIEIAARDCCQGAHGAEAYLDCVELIPGLPRSAAFVDPDRSCSNVDIGDFSQIFNPSPLLVPQTWSNVSSLFARCASIEAAGDFNGDGKFDIAGYKINTGFACGGNTSGGVSRLMCTGTAFTHVAPAGATGGPLGALLWNRLKAGDFDGDGATDLLGFNSSSGNMRALWGGATPFATITVPTPSPFAFNAGTRPDYWVGDFNGDGTDDLARIRTGSGLIGIEVARGLNPCAPSRTNPFPAGFVNRYAVNDPILTSGTFYAGDFNGDSYCDLMAAAAGDIHIYFSNGNGFRRPVKWFSGVGLPPGGFAIGDFDCDNVCDIARRDPTTGKAEMLVGISFVASLPGAPPPAPFSSFWAPLSATPVANRPLLIGDYDGNGRDDVAQTVRHNQVDVHRSCEPCPCLIVAAGTPVCDPNDATKYTLPVRITNRTNRPMTSVTLQPITGFSVSPTNVSVLSSCAAPLLPRKSRTVTVTVTGATVGAVEELRVVATVTPPGGPPYECVDRTCFVPPLCDCMQAYSGGEEWTECEPTGSGAACLNLTVQNASGITACGIQVVSLTPGVSVSPQLLCIPPLATGSSYTVNPCDIQLTGAYTGAVTLLVQLLNCNVIGCDGCACNVICEEEISFDYAECPKILGNCCVPGNGLRITTQAACLAAGGAWYGNSLPITGCGVGGNDPTNAHYLVTLNPVGNGTFVTANEEQRMFISQIPLDSSGGADISVNAATRIEVPLEEIRGQEIDDQPKVILTAYGSFDGVDGTELGELRLTRESDSSFVARADYGALGLTALEVLLVVDGQPQSFAVSGALANVTVEAWPSNVEARIADVGHGFRLDFAPPTLVQVTGGPTATVSAIELNAVSEGSQADFLTDIELRGIGLPFVSMSTIRAENAPCPGDLNGDCRVDQVDLEIVQTAFSGGGGEADANGDGIINLMDLQIVAANLGTVCACAGGGPPIIGGDTNCDGVVTVGDIGSFVLALTNPAGYAAAHPNCDINSADVNDDGFVTVADIGPFVQLLTGS